MLKKWVICVVLWCGAVGWGGVGWGGGMGCHRVGSEVPPLRGCGEWWAEERPH